MDFAPLLLFCVLTLSIAGVSINSLALVLMADLKNDYINPFSFVDRLNPKLVAEAWFHVPLLLGWLLLEHPAPGLLVVVLGLTRVHWSRRRMMKLDVTTVFLESEQRRWRRRWLAAILSHTLLSICAIKMIFTWFPMLDFERLRQANEAHAAIQEELREKIASGSASLTHMMAHSMMNPALFPGAM
mmetsp:Transcript_35190/g.75143  ORF Transcript_35190/g.75143 Transcript_35190/m.75143 type:complete len:186 (-) Transcript_35190:124-681(-)